jgi:hypothetical protein
MNQTLELYVGALLLENGKEVLCNKPSKKFSALKCAVKKRKEFNNQHIKVSEIYIIKVPIWHPPRVY